MRLLFIPSAYRTIFHHALALALERAGHEVFWASPNRRWSRWLYDHGVAPERVLDITTWGSEWTASPRPTPDDLAELRALERANGWCMYDLVEMDDLLNRRPTPYALRYLAVCARRVSEFIRANRIGVVFAEQTWAFELLIGQVCGALGVPFLRPISTRVPDDRFVFFASRREEDMVFFRDPTDDDRARAEALLRSFRNRPAPPAYATMNWSVLRFRWGRIRRLIQHAIDVAGDPFDETTLGPWGLVGKYLTMIYRGRRNRWRVPFEPARLPAERPFVLLTLHLEPESTIDVMGSPLCDQIEVARAVARTLPVTHELWVKEHRVALPNRTLDFYRELAAIPGVRLIDPFVSSLSVIPHADLVLSIAGTVCYEAALLGRPSVIMAPTVFSPAVDTDSFNPFTGSVCDLLDRYWDRPRDDARLVEFLAGLYAQSWPGTVGDAFWDPACMSEDNVGKVAEAFCAAMARCAAEPAGEPALPAVP